jgi:2-amino-4-hydroxy-6-hydroxymethyldihydropteridine diphosphokinase
VIAYLGLGSNLGDRLQNLQAAVNFMDLRVGSVLRISSIYETAPLYRADQPWFLNAVLEVKTPHAPPALLRVVKAVEEEMGRTSGERYAPRIIDIDILTMSEERGGPAITYKRESDHLILPHPALTERRFVLEPLAELAPDLVIGGLSIKAWLEKPEIQEQTVRRVAGVSLSVHSD